MNLLGLKKAYLPIDLKHGLIILSVLVLWSSSYIGIRFALHSYTPENLAFFRYLTASVVFLIVAFFQKFRIPKFADLPGLATLGLFGFTSYNLLLNYGETVVDAGTASFVINTVPFFSLIVAILMRHEKAQKKDWIGMIVAFSGVALIIISKNNNFHAITWHVFLILGAAICQALYFGIQKRFLGKYKPLELTSYAVWIGTILLLPFTHNAFLNLQLAPPSGTLTIAYLGIFPGAIAYLLVALSLNKYRVSSVSSYFFLIPFIASLIAWIAANETISLQAVLGGSFIVLGILIKNKMFRMTNRKVSAARLV